MKNKNTRRGFTLIELLVVVLIIGILAAVAVPQYQFAVDKSRIAPYLPKIADITKAEQVYYLSNGRHSRLFSELDIDLTKLCPAIASNELQKCIGNISMTIHVSPDTIDLDYCTDKDCRYSTNNKILRATFSMYTGKIETCNAYNTARGQKLCKWLKPD